LAWTAAIARDDEIEDSLAALGIAFVTHKDQVIFERDEVLSKTGTPYSVFTPYKRAWLDRLVPAHLAPHATDGAAALVPPPAALDTGVPALEAIGFRRTNLAALGVKPGMSGGAALFADFRKRIDRYREARDFPARKGPSYLSVHLRFGTVSIRTLAAFAHARSLLPGGDGAATWLSELVWREFYAQILWHRPDVVTGAFKPACNAIPFPSDPDTRSSMPRCANSREPGTCTTGCAWSPRASSSRTCSSTGGWANGISPTR
jgi:deoxyribodipyrimidine photo-lyase